MKNWKKVVKKIVVLGLSAVLLSGSADVTILNASAEEAVDMPEWETVTVELMTSAPKLFSFDEGTVEPIAGTAVNWIDRFEAPEEVRGFYDKLVEASDNDGTDDYMIEDRYFNGDNKMDIISVKETVSKTTDLSAWMTELFYRYYPFLISASSAFDRDYPEVFWNNGNVSFTYGIPQYESVDTEHYEVTFSIAVVFQNTKSANLEEHVDIRIPAYSGEAAIKAGIEARDAKVEELCDAVSGKSVYEKLEYFNSVLTKSNQYNTSDDLDSIDGVCRECICALTGSVGTAGPVCEAYARAFKVLCDHEGIPCVLVDGANHMWNYVRVDGKWYAVDVTWNDPVPGSGYPDNTGISGMERQNYLLVGSETIVNGSSFISEHPVVNTVTVNGFAFTNGPVIEKDKYEVPAYVDLSETDMSVTIPAGGIVYDKTEKKPGVEITYNNTKLAEGTDYTLSYENNVNAGSTAKVTATGKGAYTGTISKTYTISPSSAIVANLTATQNVAAGDGAFAAPTFSGAESENVAGAVTYSYDGTDNMTYDAVVAKLALLAANASVTVNYSFVPSDSNYTGTKSGSIALNVQGIDLSDAAVDLTIPAEGYTYDKSAKEPVATVVLGEKTLTMGKDYILSYKNNVNAGVNTATVTVNGTGMYVGTVDKMFSIGASSAVAVAVSTEQSVLAGEGNFEQPVFTGLDSEKVNGTLTYSYGGTTDMTYEAVAAKLAGLQTGAGAEVTYSFVPAADSNYTGTKTGTINMVVEDIEFSVGTDAATEENAVEKAANPVYGTEWTDIIKIKSGIKAQRGEAVDTDAAHFKLDVIGVPSAGTQSFRVLYSGTLGGKVYTDVVVCSGTVTVSPKEITGVIITIDVPTGGYIYDKTEKEPMASVVLDGITLVAGTDYTLSYENNRNAGTDTAVLKVTAKGNYAGTANKFFSIAPGSAVDVKVTETQNVTAGSVSFTEPGFSGIDSEPVAGTLTYSYRGMTNLSYAQVQMLLNEAGANEVAAVTYSFAVSDENYTGTKSGTITLNITGIDLSNADLILVIPGSGYTYDKTAKTPDVTVKVDGVTLAKDIDYTVAYAQNVNAGTDSGLVTVTGIGKYSNTAVKKFSIGKKTVEAAAVVTEKIYDGTTWAEVVVTVDAADVCLGDAVTVGASTGTFAVADAGSIIPVTVIMGSVTGEGSTNYNVVLEENVTGKIQARPVTVTASNQEKDYGREEVSLTYTVSRDTPLAASESLKGSLVRESGEDAGVYEIRQGTLNKENNPNYDITFVKGSYTIKAVDYTEVVEKDQTLLLGDVKLKEPVFTGVKGEEVLGTLTYGYAGGADLTLTQLLAELDALQANDTASVTYRFVPAAGGNYAGEKNGTLNLTVRDVEFYYNGQAVNVSEAVAVADTPVYGDDWSEILSLKDGFKAVRGEEYDDNRAHFTFDVTGIPEAGQQTFRVLYNGTLGKTRYTDVVVCTGTVNIAKKTVEVKAGDYKVSKVYDGTTAAGAATGTLEVVGILDGDTEVTVDALIHTYTVANVGGQEKVRLTLSLKGADCLNYELASANVEVPCEITPMTIVPVITVDGTYTYTGKTVVPAFTVKMADGTELTTADYRATFEDNTNAGTGKIVLVPVKNSNYTWADGTNQNFAIAKATYTGNKNFSVTSRYGSASELDLTTLLPEGANREVILGTILTEDTQGVLSGEVVKEGTVLKYTLNSDKNIVGKNAAVTIEVADSANYEPYRVVLQITASGLAYQWGFEFPNQIVYATYGDAPFVYNPVGAGHNCEIIYESFNTDIATVSSTGEVTILKAGKVMINAISLGNDDYYVAVANYTLDISKKQLSWDTTGLFADDTEGEIKNRRATLSGALKLSGITAADKGKVSFRCPASKLIGVYASTEAGTQKVTLGWAEQQPALEGVGAENYFMPLALPTIQGKIVKAEAEEPESELPKETEESKETEEEKTTEPEKEPEPESEPESETVPENPAESVTPENDDEQKPVQGPAVEEAGDDAMGNMILVIAIALVLVFGVGSLGVAMLAKRKK